MSASGVSGLAHADVLTQCGFSVVLFERAARPGLSTARCDLKAM